MTNETTLIIETELPIMFTCAEDAGIAKGAILKMTDGMTAALADGDGDIVAGIAAESKIADDGKTKIAVYRRGIFKGFAGTGGVTIGCGIDTDASTSDTNEIADSPVAGDHLLGTALETASSAASFLFELNPSDRNEA